MTGTNNDRERISPDEQTRQDELIFAEVSMEYADEIAAYRQEMLDAGSSFDGCFSLKRMPDIREYVDYCRNWADPDREPGPRGIWGTVILCIRKSDMKMVGSMQIHKVMPDSFLHDSGHVGYSVRPSERRKGYATRMLSKAKEILSSLGFREIYVNCLPSNEASRRTILANGGQYIETFFLERDGVDLERYRIDISDLTKNSGHA